MGPSTASPGSQLWCPEAWSQELPSVLGSVTWDSQHHLLVQEPIHTGDARLRTEQPEEILSRFGLGGLEKASWEMKNRKKESLFRKVLEESGTLMGGEGKGPHESRKN